MAGSRVSIPYIFGGLFNVVPPTGSDGDPIPLQVDTAGNLKVTFTGGSASNPAASPTGAAVPSSASYNGVSIAGILTGQTGFSLTNAVPAAVAIVDGSGNQITSFGGGTQYASGATVATPTGTQVIAWDGTKVWGVSAAHLTTANALAVEIVDANGNQITSFGGGIQFADSAASGATPTGTLAMGWDSVNSKIRAFKVDASQNLLVNVSNASIAVTGTFFQATQPVSGTFFQATQPVSIAATVTVAGSQTPTDSYANPTDAQDIFALLGGWDATNSKWQRVQVDAATGTLKVDPGTVAVTGTFFQATQPVSIAAAIDVSDRAARLLGVVYGSQAQQLKQTATNFNLQVELATGGTLYDARQIRVLTSSDVVDVSDRSARLLGHVTVDNASIAVTGTFFQATQPVSGTVTANQGTANTLANKWPVQVTDGTNAMPTGDVIARALFHEITDGTNGPVAVKAANIAAVAADPALVVAISPNNPISIAFTDPAEGVVGTATQPASAIQVGGWDGMNFRVPAIYSDWLKNQTEVRVSKLEQMIQAFDPLILGELQAIRYGIGKLIGEMLVPGYKADGMLAA